MTNAVRRGLVSEVALLVAACAPTGCVATPAPSVHRAPLTLPTFPTPDDGTIGGAAPTITVVPPGGAFTGPVTVSITTDDPGALILYTLDGSPPVPDVAEVYAGPLTVDASATLRIAAENTWGVSGVAPTFVQLEPDLDGFSSTVPIVILWSRAAAPVWWSVEYTSRVEEYTEYSLTTVEPAPGRRAVVPATATLSVRAGLRIRGSTSSVYPKAPYRLETWTGLADEDLDVGLLGMPEDGDWVLVAPLDADRTFLRDALVFALSNSIGRYAARTRHAEVFVAEWGEPVGLDDYVGVYVVEERLERGEDRIAVAELRSSHRVEPELTGGYIFKEDRTDAGEVGFSAGTADGLLEFERPFVAVEPDETQLMPEQSAYLRDLLDELGIALVSPGFVDAATGHHYEDLIDVDAWIDHHILNVFAKNPDAFRLSAYYHKDREGLLVAGPVWDMDRTMGCSTDSRSGDPTWWDATNETNDMATTPAFDHGFWRGLFSDPAFRTRYFTRFAELLDTELSKDRVDEVVDLLALELADAAPRSYAAWPDYPPREGSFGSEVEALTGWLDRRRTWVQGCLVLPDPRSCQGE